MRRVEARTVITNTCDAGGVLGEVLKLSQHRKMAAGCRYLDGCGCGRPLFGSWAQIYELEQLPDSYEVLVVGSRDKANFFPDTLPESSCFPASPGIDASSRFDYAGNLEALLSPLYANLADG
jgi:hypothetical protein